MRAEINTFVVGIWGSVNAKEPCKVLFNADGSVDDYLVGVYGHWILSESAKGALEYVESMRRAGSVSSIKWLHDEADSLETTWVEHGDRVWAFDPTEFERSFHYDELWRNVSNLSKLIVKIREAIVCHFESGCYSMPLTDGSGKVYVINVRDGSVIPTVPIEAIVLDVLEFMLKAREENETASGKDE